MKRGFFIGIGWHTAIMPFGPTHKKHRRLLVPALSLRAVEQDFEPLQEQWAHSLTSVLAENPENYGPVIHQYVRSIVGGLSTYC